jgi:hypothetical protein
MVQSPRPQDEMTASEDSPRGDLGDMSIGIVPANDETSSTPWLIGAFCLAVAVVVLILIKAPAHYAAPLQLPDFSQLLSAATLAKPVDTLTFEDRWVTIATSRGEAVPLPHKL